MNTITTSYSTLLCYQGQSYLDFSMTWMNIEKPIFQHYSLCFLAHPTSTNCTVACPKFVLVQFRGLKDYVHRNVNTD